MEYLKLTDGTVTVKVIDQSNMDNAAWPFQVVMKIGSERFKDVNSSTTLSATINMAYECFRNKSQMM